MCFKIPEYDCKINEESCVAHALSLLGEKYTLSLLLSRSSAQTKSDTQCVCVCVCGKKCPESRRKFSPRYQDEETPFQMCCFPLKSKIFNLPFLLQNSCALAFFPNFESKSWHWNHPVALYLLSLHLESEPYPDWYSLIEPGDDTV